MLLLQFFWHASHRKAILRYLYLATCFQNLFNYQYLDCFTLIARSAWSAWVASSISPESSSDLLLDSGMLKVNRNPMTFHPASMNSRFRTAMPAGYPASSALPHKGSFGRSVSKPALECFWAWMWWFQLCHLNPAVSRNMNWKSS
jgi:hypothetical protein